jgi:hypothetical protein
MARYLPASANLVSGALWTYDIASMWLAAWIYPVYSGGGSSWGETPGTKYYYLNLNGVNSGSRSTSADVALYHRDDSYWGIEIGSYCAEAQCASVLPNQWCFITLSIGQYIEVGVNGAYCGSVMNGTATLPTEVVLTVGSGSRGMRIAELTYGNDAYDQPDLGKLARALYKYDDWPSTDKWRQVREYWGAIDQYTEYGTVPHSYIVRYDGDLWLALNDVSLEDYELTPPTDPDNWEAFTTYPYLGNWSSGVSVSAGDLVTLADDPYAMWQATRDMTSQENTSSPPGTIVMYHRRLGYAASCIRRNWQGYFPFNRTDRNLGFDGVQFSVGTGAEWADHPALLYPRPAQVAPCRRTLQLPVFERYYRRRRAS